MIKKINTGNLPVLRTKAVPCIPLSTDSKNSLTSELTEFSLNHNNLWPNEIITLVYDLLDTAYNLQETCLGLAANQIWDKDSPPPAIFVAKIYNPDNPKQFKFGEFINPVIKTSGKSIQIPEGCLSYPDVSKKIKRKLNVTITFQTLKKITPITQKFYFKDTFLPIILQHENDHLNGRVI